VPQKITTVSITQNEIYPIVCLHCVNRWRWLVVAGQQGQYLFEFHRELWQHDGVILRACSDHSPTDHRHQQQHLYTCTLCWENKTFSLQVGMAELLRNVWRWKFFNASAIQYNTIIKLVTCAAVDQVESETWAVAGWAEVVIRCGWLERWGEFLVRV